MQFRPSKYDENAAEAPFFMIRVLSLKYMIDMNEYGLNSENQWVWGKKLSGVEWSGVEWSHGVQ